MTESATAEGFAWFIVSGLIMLSLASVATFVVAFYTYVVYSCLKRPVRVMRYIITKERNTRRVGKLLRKCFELRYALFALSLVFMIPLYILVIFLCLFILIGLS